MTHLKDAVSNAETGGTRSRHPGPPSPRWFSHPAVAHLFALLGYALATILFTWPLALNLTVAIPGDSFDGWQNFWNLWWVKIAFVDPVSNQLYTDLLYHPTGVGLYFQTLNPFNGVMTLPIQVAGNLYLAYNAVVFFSWVGAGFGMFLLTRGVIGQGRAHGGWAFVGPFVAGLVFTLAPVHSAHLLGHMQVFSLEWLPFYLLYLLMALQRSMAGRRWVRSALLAGLFLAFNGLCDWYFVLYLFLFTALAVVWAWGASQLSAPRSQGWVGFWRSVRPALVAGALFAVLLSFWLVPMVAEALQFKFMVRPPADLYVFSASVADFVIPNRLHSLFMPGSFEWPGNQIAPVSERTIAVGYIALVLAIVALFTARRRSLLVGDCAWLLPAGAWPTHSPGQHHPECHPCGCPQRR
ncbi:MAG: hypothetical protein IPK16_27735 [Anaerolineales bacterium]|nr:hypothetical protein [Anaerolineales bacterium]